MQFFIASWLRRRPRPDSELDQRSLRLDGGGSCVEIKLTTAETGVTSQFEWTGCNASEPLLVWARYRSEGIVRPSSACRSLCVCLATFFTLVHAESHSSMSMTLWPMIKLLYPHTINRSLKHCSPSVRLSAPRTGLPLIGNFVVRKRRKYFNKSSTTAEKPTRSEKKRLTFVAYTVTQLVRRCYFPMKNCVIRTFTELKPINELT